MEGCNLCITDAQIQIWLLEIIKGASAMHLSL